MRRLTFNSHCWLFGHDAYVSAVSHHKAAFVLHEMTTVLLRCPRCGRMESHELAGHFTLDECRGVSQVDELEKLAKL